MRRIPLILTALLMCWTALVGQKVDHLNLKVNSQLEEREPILSPDGKTLYFWRRENSENTGGIKDPGDIWRSEHITGTNWTKAERLGPPFNTIGHDFVWQVSATGDTIWINQVPEGTKGQGLKYLVRDRYGNWAGPKRAYIMGFNYNGQYKDYSITPQGHMLIPNRGDQSYGGTDMYICFRLNDSTWARPVNLGAAINTPGDEDAGFISADGKTLFFGSNGHGGKGDHDVFMSRRLDNTWQHWTQPENIGAPVNTAGYEFDFVITGNGEFAYWGAETGSYGKNDIFRLPLNTCELDVYPAGDHHLCMGEEVVLEAGFTMGERISYQWFKDGRPLVGARSRELRVNQHGDFQLVRIKDGCEVTSELIKVRYENAPRVTVQHSTNLICPEDSVQLRALSTTANGFQWRKNNLEIPGATQSVYYAKSPGSYTVEAKNYNCGTLSENIRISTFDRPKISLATDSVEARERALLPKWLWNNEVPTEKGAVYMKEVAATPGGDAYVLSLTRKKKGRYTQTVSRYFSDGVYRKNLAETEVNSLDDRFLAADNLGNFIVSSNEQYLTKYRSDGRVAWEKSETREKVTGLAVDPLDFVITSGRYKESLELEGETYQAAQRSSLYIAKHDPKGELVWVRNIAVDWFDYDFGNAVHSDCEGNSYVAGGFRSITNFGDGKILRASLKGESFFLAKYSPDGELLWAQRVVIDRNRIRTHDVYTDCNGTTYFVLGTHVLIYDKEGGLVWEGKLSVKEEPEVLRIAATTNGDIYIHGKTEQSDLFVAKINKIRKQIFLWETKGGSGDEGDVPAITADEKGSIFLAANSGSRIPPGLAHAEGSKAPAYIARYGPPQLENMNKTITICKGEGVVFYANLEPGARYQWLLNGSPISGATSHAFTATKAGDYQVGVMSMDCQQISGIQRVDDDCDDRPILVAQNDPAPTPAPRLTPPPTQKPTPTPPTNMERPDRPAPKKPSDVATDSKGRPQRLYDRRVKGQGELVIRGEEVTIAVWDYRAVDHDTISINVNGEWKLQNFGITKRQEEFTFRLDKTKENYIILYAHNLGMIPPNTVQVSIDDGVKKQSMKLESNLRSCGMLRIRFE